MKWSILICIHNALSAGDDSSQDKEEYLPNFSMKDNSPDLSDNYIELRPELEEVPAVRNSSIWPH